ncbi:MAG: PAS domain-containing protein [Alphaproteobacteria bacterium]|nr:PAS domain-containing protein [Alphaproteobacteria bacterium]
MALSPSKHHWVTEPANGGFDTSQWHPRLAALYAHWRRIHPAPGLLPGRQHIDPSAIPGVLASIWMLDVQRDPFRLKYRLVGTNLVGIHGTDYTGRWFDEARPEVLRVTPNYDRYHHMVDDRRATWRRGTPIHATDPHWHTTESAMMPLAGDGSSVDILLCGSIYYGHDGRVL